MSHKDAGCLYSIKAAAQATGLSVETLRAWERRYRVVEPKRDASGRRGYTACDVSRLRTLREITECGHPIGKLAQLSGEQLSRLLAEGEAAQPPGQQPAAALVARILCAVERYDPADCDQAVAAAFALLPAADAARSVLAPALREVGERWHRGEFTVGQERILSGSARQRLAGLLNTFCGGARGPGIVFATLSGEQHELGALTHAMLAASRQMRAHYLGTDMPPDELGNFARRVGAAAVAVSLVMPAALDEGLRQLQALRRDLPASCELWIGGGAAALADPADFPAGSIYMAGKCDFDSRLELLARSA